MYSYPLTLPPLTCTGVSPYSYYDDYRFEGFPVVISNVTCEGTESRLIDCPYTTGGSGSPVSLECSYSGIIINWQANLVILRLLLFLCIQY